MNGSIMSTCKVAMDTIKLAKSALRKEIQDVIGKITSEEKSRQSEIIYQKVNHQKINIIIMWYNFEVNSTMILARVNAPISTQSKNFRVFKHRGRSKHSSDFEKYF